MRCANKHCLESLHQIIVFYLQYCLKCPFKCTSRLELVEFHNIVTMKILMFKVGDIKDRIWLRLQGDLILDNRLFLVRSSKKRQLSVSKCVVKIRVGVKKCTLSLVRGLEWFCALLIAPENSCSFLHNGPSTNYVDSFQEILTPLPPHVESFSFFAIKNPLNTPLK